MTPDALTRFLSQLHRHGPKITRLDPHSGYSYLRHRMEPGEPEKREQMRILDALPSADFVALQPITLRDPITHVAFTARLMLIELFAKSKVSREAFCAAILTAPMHRAERRRALREINKGRDFIAFGDDLGDVTAVGRVLTELAAAPPPA